MAFLIAVSKLDIAAKNIADKIIQNYNLNEISPDLYRTGNVQLTYLESSSIFSSKLDKKLQTDAIIFASKHRSESQEPTLTVHVPGNLTDDISYGGQPRELAWAWCQRMRNALLKLNELKSTLKNDYKISYEATHHGPTDFEIPVWFVEIGSNEIFWRDEEAGTAVAEAIWASLTNPLQGKPSVGFGGGHYASKFTRLTLEGEFAFGHIMPKYALENLSEEMITDVFKKTFEKCETAILDWKGMKGGQRQKLLNMLENMKIKEIIKV